MRDEKIVSTSPDPHGSVSLPFLAGFRHQTMLYKSHTFLLLFSFGGMVPSPSGCSSWANWQADRSKTIRNPFRQHPLQTSLQNYNLQDQWERHPSLSLDDGIGTASLSMDGRMDGRILELLMERQAILQGTLRASFAAVSRPPIPMKLELSSRAQLSRSRLWFAGPRTKGKLAAFTSEF